MTRTMEITFIIILFSIAVSLITSLGILPNMQTLSQATTGQTTINNMIAQPTVTSGQQSGGYIGYFNIAIEVLQTIGSVITGTLIVAIPLMNLGCPAAIALAIQAALYALYSFDLLTLWRGQPW